MATVIDAWLRFIKWPVAIVFITLVPAVGMAVIAEIGAWRFGAENLGFLWGMMGYAAADWLVFRKRSVGDAFSTLEHELTHAVFAWLTFHRVSSLRVTWNQGGSIRIHGGSNWLISIGPYWFPTLCIPLMLVLGFSGHGGAEWAAPALGAAYVYHHITTWRETHAAQTDLQETGFLFAWCFLPTANLLSSGLILAFAGGGAGQSLAFILRTWETYLAMLVAMAKYF